MKITYMKKKIEFELKNKNEVKKLCELLRGVTITQAYPNGKKPSIVTIWLDVMEEEI